MLEAKLVKWIYLDPTPATNFYPVIVYDDAMEEYAAGIALSFEKM